MRKMLRTTITAALLLCSIIPANTFAAAPTTAPASKSIDAKMTQQFIADLTGNDPAAASAATASLKSLLAKNKHTAFQVLTHDILPALMAAHKFDPADDLAATGILTVPYEDKYVRDALVVRLQIALIQNDHDRALLLAHSLFNFARMVDTPATLPLVLAALKAAHPDDPALEEKFNHEQLPNPAIPFSDTPMDAPSLIRALPTDDKTYTAAITAFIGKKDIRSRISLANLQLLANKFKEAKQEFTDIASSPKQPTIGREGIARAIKSEDGLTPRATAFLKTPAPPPIKPDPDLP